LFGEVIGINGWREIICSRGDKNNWRDGPQESSRIFRQSSRLYASTCELAVNPLETSDYNADGSLAKKTVYERDDEGKLLKMTPLQILA
jgi:hypothetical protein